MYLRQQNVIPKGVKIARKTAALCNEIWPQTVVTNLLLRVSKFATAKIEFSFEMGK